MPTGLGSAWASSPYGRALPDAPTAEEIKSGAHDTVLYELREHVLQQCDQFVDAAKKENRNLLASEQRAFDAVMSTIGLLDDRINTVRRDFAKMRDKQDRRESEAAAGRMEFERKFGVSMSGERSGSGPADRVGDELRNAIDEVRAGRATAYVELEERALSEGGSGGYTVNTVMGDPVETLAAKSVVMSLPGVVRVNATSGDRMRFPRFGAVTVGGVAEAATLTDAATDIDAVDIVYQKFSTYELLSSELEEDASSSALTAVGNRMLKDLAIRVDNGLLQGTGASDVVGLFLQSGVSSTSVAGLPADFDKVAEAVYQLELNDGNPVAWIMHPRSWRIYKQIKTGISSDKTTLLQPDPQQAPKTLEGLPVFTTSTISITSGATSVGSIAAVVDTSQIVVVTRRPARLEVSREFKFDSDQIAIRCTTRVGLGVIDAAGGISLLTDIRAS